MKRRLLALALTALALSPFPRASAENLVKNGSFEAQDGAGRPAGFQTSGAAEYRYLGDARRDMASMGIALQSARKSGEVTCDVANLDRKSERWFRFTFRGLPQKNFAVDDENLYMKVSFFGDNGRKAYDAKEKRIYSLVADARRDLDVNGRHNADGAEAWRTYQMDFSLPFPQVDQVRLSIGFGHGSDSGRNETDFFVDDVSLARIPDPPTTPATKQPAAVIPNGKLLALGGRWFYAARDGETIAPTTFDSSNADRLLYKDAGYSAPFAGNTSAWLRPGFMDLKGDVVEDARILADNVTIRFSAGSMVIATHGIPNHPTGRFPEPGRGNPSYITEQNSTFYIPLEPKESTRRSVVDANNSNGALPMGPIGIAINGVVFFNPFDMGNVDATNMMDRCCGHPQREGQYHYHKYPICINSPWADEGAAHSPMLGWAFDGYPLYGPYERADLMAMDVKGSGALNEFNLHHDAERGWHYHVTPGKFPYLIGGYWGAADARNSQRPPRGSGGGPNSGPARGGPGGGPDGGPPRDRRGAPAR